MVYAFDLFTKIYEEEGYNTNEIPALILEHNLFGIDIDERAAQLAAFALTMKARSYYARFLRKPIQPHVIALENVNEDIIKQAVKLPLAVAGKLVYDYRDLTLYNLTQADNFGSLIQIDPEELKALQIQKGSIWQEQEQKLKEQAEYLSRQYHCVVTNPPYMGGKGMNTSLKSFVEKAFPLSKSDLMACFIERCLGFNLSDGKSGIINQHNWMFLTSYENLRRLLFNNFQIDSLMHLGARTFPEIGGEVVQNAAFVLTNSHPNGKAVFIRLLEFDSSNLKEANAIKAIKNKTIGLFFISNQKDFSKIKGDPAAYWLNKELLAIFDNPSLNDVSPPRAGLTTGDNEKFIRFNFEVSRKKIGTKWVRHTKGGGYRKWFGNNNYILNWENNGFEVKSQPNSVIRNSNYYFKQGFSWSDVGSNLPSFRLQTKDFMPNARGPMIYSEDLSLLGYLNSKITIEILKILNPTIVFNVGDIAKIPLINLVEDEKKLISSFVSELLTIYKRDEDRNETSLDFLTYLNTKFPKIEETFKEVSSALFSDLEKAIYLEEQVNSFFIKKYSLNEILNSSVANDELHFQEDILNKGCFLIILRQLKYRIYINWMSC
ncbi:MAG: BREX-1 system adenine-specific DNA-methyltransferase PglX [Bacteroidetes bacterium]|nr:BREX-1 system adenine-specific DNA-methyltransferase PglX [Bacteroidota bacterium]